MKKNVLTIIIIVTAVICLIALSFGLFYIIDTSSDSGELAFIPSENTGVNYNNYVSGTSSVDYKYGKFAWSRHNGITVVDSADTIKNYKNVGDKFQLTSKGVVYIKDNKLMIVDENDIHTVVAKKVNQFVVRNNEVLYTSDESSEDYCLYVYNIVTAEKTKLAENVIAFCIDDTQTYVLTSNTEKDSKNDILTIFSDGKPIKTLDFPVASFPFYFMVINGTVMYEEQNKIVLHNLNDDTEQSISFSDRTILDSQIYIANEKYIFVSYQALDYDGSIVKKMEHEANGLWRVDLSTMKKEKISEETFDDLMLFGDDFFVGTDGDDFYIITKDGNISQLFE